VAEGGGTKLEKDNHVCISAKMSATNRRRELRDRREAKTVRNCLSLERICVREASGGLKLEAGGGGLKIKENLNTAKRSCSSQVQREEPRLTCLGAKFFHLERRNFSNLMDESPDASKRMCVRSKKSLAQVRAFHKIELGGGTSGEARTRDEIAQTRLEKGEGGLGGGVGWGWGGVGGGCWFIKRNFAKKSKKKRRRYRDLK